MGDTHPPWNSADFCDRCEGPPAVPSVRALLRPQPHRGGGTLGWTSEPGRGGMRLSPTRGSDSSSAEAAGKSAARPRPPARLARGWEGGGRPPLRGCGSYAPLGLRRLYFLMGAAVPPCPDPWHARRRGRKQRLPPQTFTARLLGAVRTPSALAQRPARRAEAAPAPAPALPAAPRAPRPGLPQPPRALISSKRC